MTATRAKPDSLRLRVLSAIVGIPVLVFLVWASAFTTEFLAAAVTAIALYEFCRLGPAPMPLAILLLTVAGGLTFVVNAALGAVYTFPLVTAAVILPLLVTVLLPRDQRSSVLWAWSVAGMLLIGWTLSLAVLLRLHDHGREWALLALGLTFAVDSAAYFFGRAFGKRKLAPTISPGKTWEGSIAGFAAGGVVAALLVTVFGLGLPWYQAALLGLVMSIASQLGDLAESMMKRGAGAKDAGVAVPGHGGLLDRLDSLIPSFAVLYCFVTYLA